MGDDTGHHRVGLVSIFCYVVVISSLPELYRNSLNVKLGHRRVCLIPLLPLALMLLCTFRLCSSCSLHASQKLQRAIAEYRGLSADRPLLTTLNLAASIDTPDRSDDSPPDPKIKQGESAAQGAPTTTKRKYRRHPKVSAIRSI